MSSAYELGEQFRDLGDEVSSTCTDVPAHVAQERLQAIWDDANTLVEQLGESAATPPPAQLLASWRSLHAAADEYVSSRDRIDEGIWAVDVGHSPKALPPRLLNAFARYGSALACLDASLDD